MFDSHSPVQFVRVCFTHNTSLSEGQRAVLITDLVSLYCNDREEKQKKNVSFLTQGLII